MASSPADTSTETVETSQVGFSSLPRDVIATHVLRPDFLPDPADLGRLRAVCKGLRDAVYATGRPVYELTPEEAVRLGDLNGLQLLLERAPRVRRDLCAIAAEVGNLDVLKWARENDCRVGLRTVDANRARRSVISSR
jgi:hypothetical protein